MAISTTRRPVDPARVAERPEVIVIDHVRKRFVVRKDNTISERIVTLGRAGRKHRQDFWALDDVTVSIQAGTTVGLIGQNGSGKSTLLKAIGGIIQPTSGTVAPPRSPGGPARARRRLPPGPDRPRERLPQREPARLDAQGDRGALRRHPRVLRASATSSTPR